MKRLIRLAARLYPPAWRARYGDEFEAVIEDSRGSAREFVDVLFGALKMQLTRGGYLQFAAVAAVGGFAVAGVIALRTPARYVATSVLHNTSPDTELRAQEALSRSSLTELIRRPSLDLYRDNRQRWPMDMVVEIMRRRDLRVYRSGNDLKISFTYPDAAKARMVVGALAARLIEGNAAVIQRRQAIWPEVWRQLPVPQGGFVVVTSSATLPEGSNPLPFLAAGTFCGLALGVVSLAVLRHRRTARRVIGFALAGGAVAAVASFLGPDTYVSTATLRITPPLVSPAADGAGAPFRPEERFDALRREALSRSTLLAIIQRASLRLYEKKLAGRPADELVEQMRRDLSVRWGGANAFTISFAYGDRFKAQAVVRELVTQFIERNIATARAGMSSAPPGDPARVIEFYRAGSNLEVLDPASDPAAPIAPHRPMLALAGLMAGMMLAALTLVWQRARAQHRTA
ncbi:MAG: hypothetical protein ABI759_13725 [Candidatus Solibacter sp.]